MKTIRVQYDAYNRQFKLLDRAAANLHDGETYVVLDTAAFDFESEFLFLAQSTVKPGGATTSQQGRQHIIRGGVRMGERWRFPREGQPAGGHAEGGAGAAGAELGRVGG